MKLTVIAINEIVIDNKNNPDKFKVFQKLLINEIYLKEIIEKKNKLQQLITLYKFLC